MSNIIDAGHYYQSKGPTIWSALGWNLVQRIASSNDKLLLFIDDVHPVTDLHPLEQSAAVVETFKIEPDYIVLESAVRNEALEILNRLKQLPKKKGIKNGSNGQWFCSGSSITDPAGNPLCSLLDAGLTLFKQRLGFISGINVLPFFYENQQRHLGHLVKKSIPDFSLTTILFDINGAYWSLLD
jgi:hypothetical protein